MSERSETRREFLATAGGMGAGAVLASELAPAAPQTVSKTKDSTGRSSIDMKLGVNLEYVRHADKSLAYGVKKAGEIGYEYVEPCFLMGRCLLSNAGYCHVTSMDTDPQQIKAMMEEAGVKISGLSTHSDLLDPEFGVLYARKGIHYAKALGVDIVQICETMFPPDWMKEDDAYAIMKIVLRAISETCADNGVYIAVEQHGPYTAKIKSLLRILELVDSPWIRVNYDCGNTFLSGEDPYEMLDAVADKIVHVHAKDISVEQAEEERGKVTGTAVGCACGDGVIDWKRVVTRLKQAGYEGVLSVECGTEDEAVRSLAHMKSVLRELGA